MRANDKWKWVKQVKGKGNMQCVFITVCFVVNMGFQYQNTPKKLTTTNGNGKVREECVS